MILKQAHVIEQFIQEYSIALKSNFHFSSTKQMGGC
jgi:hypothetical protein